MSEPRLFRRTLIPFFLATIALGMFPPHPASGQGQVVPIQTLTELPAPIGRRLYSPPRMAPAKPIDIPDNVKIEEPFAWNRTDRYAAPDPDSFFPDDAEGGKQLDALFGGKLGGNHKPEEVFAVVRRGFRTTTRHRTLILAEIGKGFIWDVKDQDPRAIELMYHASEFPGAEHYAMYFGLTVVSQRSENLIRTMMQRFTTYDHEIQGRILWGFTKYGDHEDTKARLERLLDQPEGLGDSTIVAALDLYQKFVGEPYPDLSQFENVGLFVIGFESEGLDRREQLRKQVTQWAGEEEAVAQFVLRIADGKPVGVGLIRGVANREKILTAIEESRESKLVFSETFAPVVLQARQLREFAPFLPDGLPENARPVYAAPPTDEKFAWNATDGYVPPDFFGYFPDDPQAGAELDRLYENRNTTELTAREVLEKARRGLRHSSLRKNVLMGWISGASGWPSDPMAREIAYHAADPKADQETRYNAIYFGLRGWWDKTPNVLRLFAEILITEPCDHSLGHNPRSAILWSFRNKEDEKKVVAEYLAHALENHADFSPEKLAALTADYEQLTGNKPPNYQEFSSRGRFVLMFRNNQARNPEQLQEIAQDAFGNDPRWLHVTAWQEKSTPQAIAVVQGMDGLQWLVQAMRQAGNFSLDYGGPFADLDPSAIQKFGLEKFQEESSSLNAKAPAP